MLKTKPLNKKSARTKSVAFLGITLAVMILLQLFSSLLQKLGMPMSLALGLIPVLVISQTHGTKYGAVSGCFFGLITLLFSVIYMGAIPMYRVTANPLVSVFPRIMTGVICALSYRGFMRLAQKRAHTFSQHRRRFALICSSMAATILGTVTNTVLFLGMFYAFAHGRTFDSLVIDFKWVLSSIVALNTVIELLIFSATVPFIVYAMTQSRLAEKIGLQRAQTTNDDRTDTQTDEGNSNQDETEN